jgi:hypothetical protein
MRAEILDDRLVGEILQIAGIADRIPSLRGHLGHLAVRVEPQLRVVPAAIARVSNVVGRYREDASASLAIARAHVRRRPLPNDRPFANRWIERKHCIGQRPGPYARSVGGPGRGGRWDGGLGRIGDARHSEGETPARTAVPGPVFGLPHGTPSIGPLQQAEHTAIPGEPPPSSAGIVSGTARTHSVDEVRDGHNSLSAVSWTSAEFCLGVRRQGLNEDHAEFARMQDRSPSS